MADEVPYYPVHTFVSFPGPEMSWGIICGLHNKVHVSVLSADGMIRQVPVTEVRQIEPPMDPSVPLPIGTEVAVYRGFLTGMSGKVLGHINGRIFVRPNMDSEPINSFAGTYVNIGFVSSINELIIFEKEYRRKSIARAPTIPVIQEEDEEEKPKNEEDEVEAAGSTWSYLGDWCTIL